MIDERINLAQALKDDTGIAVERCYQCGKCSAGCPLAEDMEFTSSMVLRILQSDDLQMQQELLESEAIWLCASCEMCLSRCPMEVDIPAIMDYLRQCAVREGVEDRYANRNVTAFHRAFLDMVRVGGRSYEIGMVADYKMRSGKLMQDVPLAPKMFFKGKLPIIPGSVKGRKNIRKIFNKSKEAWEKQ